MVKQEKTPTDLILEKLIEKLKTNSNFSIQNIADLQNLIVQNQITQGNKLEELLRSQKEGK